MALRTKCSSWFRFNLCFVLLIWVIFLSVFLGKGDSLQLSLQSEFMIRKYITFSSAIWVTAVYIYFKIYNYTNSNSIFGVWILQIFFFTRKLLWAIMLLQLYREFWNFNTYMNFYVWITVCLKNAMYICYDHTDRHRLFWMPRVGQSTPKQDKLSSWLTTHPPLRSGHT